MNPKLKNLIVRTLAGAVYVALMIAGVFYPALMDVVLCVAACVCIYELSKITCGPEDKPARYLMMAFAVSLFAVACYYSLQPRTFIFTPGMKTLTAVFLMIPMLMMLLSIILSIVEIFRHRACPVEQIGKSVFGFCWIVAPLAMLAAFAIWCKPMALAFLLLIWINDTAAYLGGTLYGRTKMFERVSPKKTWEGTFTGFVITVIAAVVFPSIPFFGRVHMPIWAWVCFAVIVVVFGTFGDLLESAFKRNAGVKDTGKAIPGHGGMLDRFDSILLAVFPAMLFLFIILS
ncbi:MAG: phosphatidate cytidylyltransferase [Bacteroidales bacterium]|nr:phosphatidate cytidylyltransferase [Bacteroidales bacterium]